MQLARFVMRSSAMAPGMIYRIGADGLELEPACMGAQRQRLKLLRAIIRRMV